MKIIKKIAYFLLGAFVFLCGFVIVCAYRPDLTKKIARFLYQNQYATMDTYRDSNIEGGTPANRGIQDTQTGNIPNGSISENDTASGNGSMQSDETMPDNDSVLDSAIVQDNEPNYVPPSISELEIPENVSGRNGYEPLQEDREQVGEEEARQLENQLGTGSTGDDLTFDKRFYPYYYMLNEKGQHLYRQICANANALNAAFAPVETVTSSQLRNIFMAVFNDHPELFWLNTAYSGKYRGNGQCVEIDLKFNRTAQNLEQAQRNFEQGAERILVGAQNLDTDYEKERFVHDSLIDAVSYNLGAELNQSAYSALVNGQTVCAGYARAFQYLLQQLEIPCYCCTGFAGESHAWNIVALEDGYYNVDTTWDDTEGGNYDYFNKTDQDYGNTHIRQELSVNLPPCNGQLYRNLEQSESKTSESVLRSIEDIGVSEDAILHNLPDYNEDCKNQVMAAGKGSYEFYNVIEGEELFTQWYTMYQTGAYRQAYMENALRDIGASFCEMDLKIEELEQGRYLVTHSVNIR